MYILNKLSQGFFTLTKITSFSTPLLLNKWTVLSIIFSFLPGIVCLEENPSPQTQPKNLLYCTDVKMQCLLWMCMLFCFWGSVQILWAAFNCVWFIHSADRRGFGIACTISTWTSLCAFLDTLIVVHLILAIQWWLNYLLLGLSAVQNHFFAKYLGSLLQATIFTHIIMSV